MTDDERAEVNALHKQNSELLEIMSAIPWEGEGDTDCTNVKHWRDGRMVLRWCAAGMVAAS
jgi:hypothetical protein